MSALTARAVARAMLILDGRYTAGKIARELTANREAVAYWLARMRESGQVERQRRSAAGGGYEWWLTSKGRGLAVSKPDAEETPRPANSPMHYDHRALSGALGMNRCVTPLTGRVRIHILEGGR